MKYLIYDADVNLEIFKKLMKLLGPSHIRTVKERSLETVAGFDEVELSTHPVITLAACVDQDGVEYESFEFVATMRFTKDGAVYLSNGHFAVDTEAMLREQTAILEELLSEHG